MGELARFDDLEDNDTAFTGSDGGELNYAECQNLIDVYRNCAEVQERDTSRAYLEWGKYLVKNLIVSDWYEDDGHNVYPPNCRLGR